MSDTKRLTQTRRRFLLSTGAGSAGLLLGLQSRAAPAQAGALPHLTPADPLAKSLGYTDDATSVDHTKYPTYKPGDRCDKCRFYQGTAGQAWGPCQIFMGKAVNAHGWCATFALKT